MAYSIRCADSGGDCPGEFTTETQQELMSHVELHAAQVHPDMEFEGETREQLLSFVRTV
ncbi:MAG: DUF1059 domain-containing protein [Actinobacteria bacterium]|nr:DUF1059 domain-containing protein [Actinomycetota bacterium]